MTPTKKQAAKEGEQQIYKLADQRLESFLVAIDSVKQDPENPRRRTPRNLETIKASLAHFGQRVLIVVNEETGIIEKGNGIHAAATALGWTHIAAMSVNDSEQEAKAFGIADNRAAELSEWDFERLQLGLGKISDEGLKLVTGFSMDEVQLLSPMGGGNPGASAGAGAGAGVSGSGGDISFLVQLSFATKEAAEEWLDAQGFDVRFKPGAHNTVIDMP